LKQDPLNKNCKAVQCSAGTQTAGKGHKETLEIAYPLKHTTDVPDAFDGHVPENGGT
jgi:hypothetical protein